MNKNNKNPNVPNLRFSDYNDSLKNICLSELLSFQNGINADSNKYGRGIKYISVGDIINNDYITYDCIKGKVDISQKELNNYLVENGDILFQRSSETFEDIGNANVYLDEQPCTFGGFVIRGRKIGEYDPKYLNYLLKSPNARKQVIRLGAGAQHYNISQESLNKIILSFPSAKEQEKISRFLTKIEEQIQLQNKIINKYESLIKSIEEEILWKGSDSRYVPIKEFLVERNEKSAIQDQYPVLSSTVKGLFLQSDYFQREIASSNNIGYKITKLNDIIISPQNLWMGNITYNDKFENGIISPSYHIYEIKDGYNKQYIATILKSHKAFYCYKNISEQGASVVRRNLNMDAFLNIMFPIPTKEKQDEAGVIIQQLHLKLDIEKQYLNSLLSQKTYLLNNMFI